MSLEFVAAVALIVCLLAGLILFLIGWYHGWHMFTHRSGDWRGYYFPLGFLLDATLDADGLYHRRKMLTYLAWAAPFLAMAVLTGMALGI